VWLVGGGRAGEVVLEVVQYQQDTHAGQDVLVQQRESVPPAVARVGSSSKRGERGLVRGAGHQQRPAQGGGELGEDAVEARGAGGGGGGAGGGGGGARGAGGGGGGGGGGVWGGGGGLADPADAVQHGAGAVARGQQCGQVVLLGAAADELPRVAGQ